VRLVAEAVQAGQLDTAHDLAEGGLAVALAEMAIAGDLGAEVDLDLLNAAAQASSEAMLFGEAAHQIVVALPAAALESLLREAEAAGVPCTPIGRVGGDRLRIRCRQRELEVALPELRRAFERPIAEALA
jgi:phosphoribosylformylglycinamidine synthase